MSQYCLATHLGTTLVLYVGMFAAALSVTADWRFARDGTWGRLRDGRTWDGVLRNPLVRHFKAHVAIVTGLVFLTALSGTSIPFRVLSSVRGSEIGPRCVRRWARRGPGLQ